MEWPQKGQDVLSLSSLLGKCLVLTITPSEQIYCIIYMAVGKEARLTINYEILTYYSVSVLEKS